ncbi:MAG TPA: MOSC domain-containing protein [Acidimicrobiales bacterium]|nr:MOSC domain-containing protein [Acidimicrobiales bacterium]
MDVPILTEAQLEAALPDIRNSPATGGTLDLIVARPSVDERALLDEGQLDLAIGLVGDSWSRRPGPRAAAQPDPERQLTVINARFSRLIGGDSAGAALAGDQLHVDLDLSEHNAPAGTRLRVGEAVIEITVPPHTGCQKFSSRFGPTALRFVNSPVGQALHLRGVNARVIVPGRVRVGDPVHIEPPAEVSGTSPPG